MLRAFIIFASIILAVSSSGQASACIALQMPPADYNRAAESAVVFSGVALKTKASFGEFSVTVFEVKEKTKGFILGDKVSIKHRTKQKFCEMPIRYKQNQEYVVYANRNFLGRLYVKQPASWSAVAHRN